MNWTLKKKNPFLEVIVVIVGKERINERYGRSLPLLFYSGIYSIFIVYWHDNVHNSPVNMYTYIVHAMHNGFARYRDKDFPIMPGLQTLWWLALFPTKPCLQRRPFAGIWTPCCYFLWAAMYTEKPYIQGPDCFIVQRLWILQRTLKSLSQIHESVLLGLTVNNIWKHKYQVHFFTDL